MIYALLSKNVASRIYTLFNMDHIILGAYGPQPIPYCEKHQGSLDLDKTGSPPDFRNSLGVGLGILMQGYTYIYTYKKNQQ